METRFDGRIRVNRAPPLSVLAWPPGPVARPTLQSTHINVPKLRSTKVLGFNYSSISMDDISVYQAQDRGNLLMNATQVAQK